jgi:hypothetical protein
MRARWRQRPFSSFPYCSALRTERPGFLADVTSVDRARSVTVAHRRIPVSASNPELAPADLAALSAGRRCRSASADAQVVPGAGIEPARGFPQGIFVLTTAFAAAWCHHAFGVWTLPLPCRAGDLGRGRQVSTLSSPHGQLGLARGCSHPNTWTGSPTLTPFTAGVSP